MAASAHKVLPHHLAFGAGFFLFWGYLEYPGQLPLSFHKPERLSGILPKTVAGHWLEQLHTTAL
jgi:hypothetical protein